MVCSVNDQDEAMRMSLLQRVVKKVQEQGKIDLTLYLDAPWTSIGERSARRFSLVVEEGAD